MKALVFDKALKKYLKLTCSYSCAASPLIFLTFIWTFMIVLIDPIGDFPLNDDWVYGRAVRLILTTGRFALPSAASANVIIQAYWGALFCLPFGFSFTALRFSTIILGGAGILALYSLLREFSAPRPVAVAGAMTLAVNPIYLSLAASFMTDVPFTALFTISLWLYVRGAKRNSAGTITAAFAVAFTAVFIRQFGLVLFLGFGAAHLARRGLSGRALVIATLPMITGIVLQLGYDHWLVATGRTPEIPVALTQLIPFSRFGLLEFIYHIAQFAPLMIPYPGLFLIPFWAYVFLARHKPTLPLSQRPANLAGSALLAIAVAILLTVRHVNLPAMPNILIPSGLGPLTLRDTYILNLKTQNVSSFVTSVWIVATITSASVTVFLVRAIIATAGSVIGSETDCWPVILMLTVVFAYLGGTIMTLGANGFIFDRYLLPLIPPMTAVLVAQRGHGWRSVRRWQLLPCLLCFALYAGYALPAEHDYLAWNRTRWRATDYLINAGIPPALIDGGYEFDGWYLYDTDYKQEPDKSYWWGRGNKYVIASGPIPGYQETARFTFNRWFQHENATVIVLRRTTH